MKRESDALKIKIFVVMALCLLAVSAGAQQAGDHRGLLVGLYNDPECAWHGWGWNILFHLDAQNRPSTAATNPSGAWPYWSMPFGMTMDVDNRTVLMPANLDLNNQRMAIVRWDPALPGVVGTLWSGPDDIYDWSNVTLDVDGDLVTVGTSPMPARLRVFDRSSGKWTSRVLPGIYGMLGMGGLVWDKSGGGFLLANSSTLYRVSHDGRVIQTLAGPMTPGTGAKFGGDLAGNGDWVASSGAGVAYHVVKAGTSVFRPGPLPGPNMVGLEDVTHEKWAAPGEGFYGVSRNMGGTILNGGVYYVDPARLPGSMQRIYSASLPHWPYGFAGLEVLPLYERDLATLRSGPASWLLSINPADAALAGKPYIVAASLSPAIAPIRLADGRELYLTPDPLTSVTATGPLPPFITGNVGVLGIKGSAVGRVDLTSLGQGAQGLVIHLCGVVLDPTAPNGVAWVFDPVALVVDVLPS